VARTRTTKKLAQRIDLNYFKRPTPLKRAKFWLSLLLPLLALVWIAWRGFSGDHRVYSSGRLSEPHAVLEKECAACHLRQAGQFSAKVADSACLACHDGPAHHAKAKKSLACGTCHGEHRGRINISAVSNQSCAECHMHLNSVSSKPLYTGYIGTFKNTHPEFAALRLFGGQRPRDPCTIKLNHAIHLKSIRRGPTDSLVQLECRDCHRPESVSADWTYGDEKYAAAKHSYSDSYQEESPIAKERETFRKPSSGRELMAPVKFANACAGCHLLTFDKRFDEGVPHDKTEVVHAFLIKSFSKYIARHPGEMRVARDPKRDLTGKPIPPEVRVLTPIQWVTERVADAEELLWRKTCKQCHDPRFRNKDSLMRIAQLTSDKKLAEKIAAAARTTLPFIAPADVTLQWMPHAKFDHSKHEGFTCVSCHAKALTSTESSDILLPGIETCKKCHAPGPEHAESRCFECHTYHDWSKRKEVTPKFTLPALRTGNR